MVQIVRLCVDLAEMSDFAALKMEGKRHENSQSKYPRHTVVQLKALYPEGLLKC